MALWIDDDPEWDYQLTRTKKDGSKTQHINVTKHALNLLHVAEYEWKDPIPATVVALTPKTKTVRKGN